MTDLSRRYFEDDILIDACQNCIAAKTSLRETFIRKMKSFLSYRGHGVVWRKSDEIVYDMNTYTNDELRTMLKLIKLGSSCFHFVLEPSSEINIEYEGIFLKTEMEHERYS